MNRKPESQPVRCPHLASVYGCLPHVGVHLCSETTDWDANRKSYQPKGLEPREDSQNPAYEINLNLILSCVGNPSLKWAMGMSAYFSRRSPNGLPSSAPPRASMGGEGAQDQDGTPCLGLGHPSAGAVVPPTSPKLNTGRRACWVQRCRGALPNGTGIA